MKLWTFTPLDCQARLKCHMKTAWIRMRRRVTRRLTQILAVWYSNNIFTIFEPHWSTLKIEADKKLSRWQFIWRAKRLLNIEFLLLKGKTIFIYSACKGLIKLKQLPPTYIYNKILTSAACALSLAFLFVKLSYGTLTLWMLGNFLKIDYIFVCFLKPLNFACFLWEMMD